MKKIVRLALHDLVNMASKQTRVFFIMLISLIAVSTSMFIITGIMLFQMDIFEKDFLHDMRVYHIILGNPNTANRTQLQELIGNLMSMDITELECDSTVAEDLTFIQVKGVSAPMDEKWIVKGRNFNKEDFSKNGDLAIISSEFSPQVEKGKVYVLRGKEFEVIGITSLPSHVIIPLKSFLNSGFKASRIMVVFTGIPRDKTAKALEDTVNRLMPGAQIIYPPKVNEQMIQGFILFGAVLLCLIIFAISNIASLFRFWARENTLQYSIYSLCGAKNICIYAIVLLQALLMGLLAYGFGYLINLFIVRQVSTHIPIPILSLEHVLGLFFIYCLSIYFGVGKTARFSSSADNILETLNSGG